MLPCVATQRDLTIRPLGVGAIIDRAVVVTLRHFGPLFVAMLLVQAPAFALVRLTSARAGDLLALLADPQAAVAHATGLAPLAALVGASLVLLQFLSTAAVSAVVAGSLAGLGPGAGLVGPVPGSGPVPGTSPTSPMPASRRLGAAFSAAACQLLVLAVAPLLGALPGLWLVLRSGSEATLITGLFGGLAGAVVLFLVTLLRTVLAPAVAAVEGLGGLAALRRSSRLMAPRPGQPLLERPGLRASVLLLTTFVLALAVNGLASLPRLMAAQLAGGGPMGLLPGALPSWIELTLALFETGAGAALQPFSLAAVAVFYFERRARLEGLDVALWIERLHSDPGPRPAACHPPGATP